MPHTIIHILVPGSDKNNAISNANAALDQLVESGDFAYYSTGKQMHQKHIPDALKADTPEGKALIEQSFKSAREKFLENIEIVRSTLAMFTNNELLEADPGGKPDQEYHCRMFGSFCSDLGTDRGPGVKLYDEEGNGILATKELDVVLKQANMWLVTAEAHS